jgi:hypothetical protein
VQPLRFPTAGLPAPFGARKGFSPEKSREIAGDRPSDPIQGLVSGVLDPYRKTQSRRYWNHLAELGKSPTGPGHHDCQLKIHALFA